MVEGGYRISSEIKNHEMTFAYPVRKQSTSAESDSDPDPDFRGGVTYFESI